MGIATALSGNAETLSMCGYVVAWWCND